MRRIARIAFAALAITALCDCNDIREYAESVSEVGTHLVFTATNEVVFPDTKTQRMEDGATWWKTSEEISVFYGSGSNGGSKFTSTNTTLQKTVTFDGSIQMSESGKDYWAVYPYSQDNECDGNSITTIIPSYQTASEGNFPEDAFPTVAKSKTLDLAFWNICGGIKFFVTRSDIKSVSFKGNNGETLAGKVKVSFNASGVPEVTEVLDGSSKVTLTAPGGGTFRAGKYYYLTLLPTALNSGFTMELVAATEAGSIVTNKSQSLKRSIFGILGETDSKVEEWTEQYHISVRSVGDIVYADGLGVVAYVGEKKVLLMSVGEIKQKNWKDSNAWCVSYGDSWRMPSIDELSIIHSNFEIINNALSSKGYTTITTGNYCYWSSTQNPKNSNYYYRVRLKDGLICTGTGNDEYKDSKANYTRAVKELEIVDSTVPVEYIVLRPSSAELVPGAVITLSVMVFPEEASSNLLSWKSSNQSVATVDSKGNVTAIKPGSTTITVTSPNSITAKCIINVVRHDVDLGLSVLWSDCNLGTSFFEGAGDYYAWGEITPKKMYDWSNYLWCDRSESKLTKYNTSRYYGNVDSISVLQSDDDVASVNWRGKWRIPTLAEVKELFDCCDLDKTTVNGITGYRLTSLSTGNSIFFPLSGVYRGDSLTEKGITGIYWTSDLSSPPNKACSFYFMQNKYSIDGSDERRYGYSIRPVCDRSEADVNIPVAKIVIPSTLQLYPGQSTTISATILPEYATGDKTLFWSSSDASIAVVTKTGMVVGLSEGSATISVECQGVSAHCEVTVLPYIHVTGIHIDTHTLKICGGDMHVIFATVSPSDASNKKVNWSSSNPNVARIESSADNQARIRACGSGSATITARTDDGGFTDSCYVLVDVWLQ